MAENDRAHQFFHRPAPLYKFPSEIVQQFGVRGAISGHAKIIHRGDEPLLEQMLPDPIDHDALG